MHVQTEGIAEQSVAAMSQAERLQSGKQPALLFIEQPMEEKDGGLEFLGRARKRFGVDRQGKSLGAATGQGLIAALGRIDGGIEKLAIDLQAAQPLLLHQMM